MALIHLFGWVLCLRHHPVIALGFLTFYIHSMVPTYRAFWATYPYMYSLRNLLAAVAVDFSPVPVGLWGILTINTDSWVHGDGNSARKQPGIASKATDRLEALAQATGDAAGQFLAGSWEPMALHARAASQPPMSDSSGDRASTGAQTRAVSHQPVSGLSGELSCSNGSSMEPDFGDQTEDSSMASSEADEQSDEDEFEDDK